MTEQRSPDKAPESSLSTGGTHRRSAEQGAFPVWWHRRVTAGKAWWRHVSARPGIAHLMAAGKRYSDRLGTQFAGAITYFSFLSLVPILMVSFSAAGLVLAVHPDLLDSLKSEVLTLIPSDKLAESVDDAIDQALRQAWIVGLIGLVTAAYSGTNWMRHVRESVRAQWRPRWKRTIEVRRSFLMRYAWDFMSLLSLLLAVVLSFTLTAVGTAAQDLVVGWLGIGDIGFLRQVLRFGPFVVAIFADTLIFAWVYTILPYKAYRADWRTLFIGSLAMAVAFEVLKAALTILVSRVSSSPSFVAFGAVIGLLLFFNLVARVFLMVAAWIATGIESRDASQVREGLDRIDDEVPADASGSEGTDIGPEPSGPDPGRSSAPARGDGARDDAARSGRGAMPAPVTVVLQGQENTPRYRRAMFGAGAVSGWVLARILRRRSRSSGSR